MNYLALLLLALALLVPAGPALASEAEVVETPPALSITPDAWERKVRGARGMNTLGLVFLIPASPVLVGGITVALVGDSDAILVAGLGGGMLGLIGTLPVYAGVYNLDRYLRDGRGAKPSPVLFHTSVALQGVGVVLMGVAIATGEVGFLIAGVGAGAVQVHLTMAMALHRNKLSRDLASTPPVARGPRVLPVLAPMGRQGAVAGLAGSF